MRTITAITAITLVAIAAQAGSIPAGTGEIAMSGSYNKESAAGTSINGSVQLGYFPIDNTEIGILGDYRDNDLLTAWSGGIFAEYNLAAHQFIVPFVGVSASYTQTDINDDEELAFDDYVSAAATAGLKFFVTPRLAIAVSYVFTKANEDVFVTEDDVEDTDTRADLGMRYYF